MVDVRASTAAAGTFMHNVPVLHHPNKTYLLLCAGCLQRNRVVTEGIKYPLEVGRAPVSFGLPASHITASCIGVQHCACKAPALCASANMLF